MQINANQQKGQKDEYKQKQCKHICFDFHVLINLENGLLCATDKQLRCVTSISSSCLQNASVRYSLNLQMLIAKHWSTSYCCLLLVCTVMRVSTKGTKFYKHFHYYIFYSRWQSNVYSAAWHCKVQASPRVHRTPYTPYCYVRHCSAATATACNWLATLEVLCICNGV